MTYLVDADVLSEGTKSQPNAAVIQWLFQNETELLVNPIVLGELEYGILQLPQGKRRTALEKWFQAGAQSLNVLEIDAGTAAHWARLLSELRRKGKAMPIKDSLIAASARQHGLTVATRNTADFRHAGVPLVDPFTLL